MAEKKYVSPQQEMEELAASLSQFFKMASIAAIDPIAQPGLMEAKKKQAERLQVLIKQNGIGHQSSH